MVIADLYVFIYFFVVAIVARKVGQTQNTVFANALLAVFRGRRSPGGTEPLVQDLPPNNALQPHRGEMNLITEFDSNLDEWDSTDQQPKWK